VNAGQEVTFRIYDPLFHKIIEGKGTLIHRVFGKLWDIKPEKHEGLSGDPVMVHESHIQELYTLKNCENLWNEAKR